MRLQAIDKSTGRLLMVSAGTVGAVDFKRTVLGCFPSISEAELAIVGPEGLGEGGSGRKRQGGSGVVWRGSFTDLGGYANMNREICLRLPFHGIRVKADILPTAPQVDEGTLALLNGLSSARVADDPRSTLVVGFTPMSVPRIPGRRVVFFTMMETQELHPEFVSRCNESATEIWVPCQFYRDVFYSAGVRSPITVVPLGINHNIYRPDAVPFSSIYTEFPSGQTVDEIPDSFRFMSLFGWSHRKGPDVLCRSYLDAFDSRDDVSLVIYSRYHGSSAPQYKDHVKTEISRWYRESGKGSPPRIYYCGEEIPVANLPGAYTACDCFVFASRGEGFGLPVIEAGACGLPVVSAYHTAMTEYLDEETAFLVHPTHFTVADERLTWISGYYSGQRFADFDESGVKTFSDMMRAVASRPEEAKIRAEEFRRRILLDYTWDHCAGKVADLLRGSV